MEFTATVIRYIYSMQFMWLLATLIIQPASPFGANVVCENLSTLHMTSLQVKMCKQYSGLMTLLFKEATTTFMEQLHNQFRHERWNGTVVPPIFGTTDKFLKLETKETAFVYALASAAVVHTIAHECKKLHKHTLPYCGCASLKHKPLPNNEKWSGCSPDIDFAMNFTKRFLDSRVENEHFSYKQFVLHNNKIGRSAVFDYKYKVCTCSGPVIGSSCSKDNKCQMKLPTMVEVAKKLRQQYKESQHSKIRQHRPNSPPLIVDKDSHQRVNLNKMIHLKNSPSYCEAVVRYNIKGTAGRDCVVGKHNTSSSHHCNNLCCDYGYEKYVIEKPKPCKCKFIWCCEVKCETCKERKIMHRCKKH